MTVVATTSLAHRLESRRPSLKSRHIGPFFPVLHVDFRARGEDSCLHFSSLSLMLFKA